MPESLLLLKTQKNEVFDILLNESLEPADFTWSQERGELLPNLLVSRLNYRSGHFYFKFDFALSSHGRNFVYYCIFTPGGKTILHKDYPDDWTQQKEHIRSWAKRLKQEIEAPDLWQEIEKYRPTFSLVPPSKLLNEPIPAYEAEDIGESLRGLAGKIESQFKLSSEQTEFVRSKLNYLADAAKRQGRLDWVHTCIGVLITVAMGLALAPEEAGRLWQLVRNLLGKFIHLIGH